jgi:hypothetical protein
MKQIRNRHDDKRDLQSFITSSVFGKGENFQVFELMRPLTSKQKLHSNHHDVHNDTAKVE